MWAVNYISPVKPGGSHGHNDVTILIYSQRKMLGCYCFEKTYWKQRFNYEIKLYGSQGDIQYAMVSCQK